MSVRQAKDDVCGSHLDGRDHEAWLTERGYLKTELLHNCGLDWLVTVGTLGHGKAWKTWTNR